MHSQRQAQKQQGQQQSKELQPELAQRQTRQQVAQQRSAKQQQQSPSNLDVVYMAANPHVDTLTARDLQFLEEDGFINDEIVNFQMGLYQLEAMHFAAGSLQTWVFFNTFFYAKLAE